MDGAKPTKRGGIEVPAEERTPLVEHLLRVIEELRTENRQLRDEIDRLKGLPRRPTIRPSTLNASHPDPTHKKKRRGKRPGSAKRQKTGELVNRSRLVWPSILPGRHLSLLVISHSLAVKDLRRLRRDKFCQERLAMAEWEASAPGNNLRMPNTTPKPRHALPISPTARGVVLGILRPIPQSIPLLPRSLATVSPA